MVVGMRSSMMVVTSLAMVVQGMQVIEMMIVIMKWKHLSAGDQGRNQLLRNHNRIRLSPLTVMTILGTVM